MLVVFRSSQQTARCLKEPAGMDNKNYAVTVGVKYRF